MRVLQLNMHYSGTGADRCARELYLHLPQLGIETAIWVSDRRPGDPTEVRGLRRGWEKWLSPLEVLPDLTDWRHRGSIAALRGISENDFDLVHIHNIHSGLFSIRAVHDLCERFPCIWTLHDEWAPTLGLTYELSGKITPAETMKLSRGPLRYLPYYRYHDNFKWRRTRPFLRRWLPQPKAVICPSRYMAEMARSAGVFPSSEIVQIPNGTAIQDLPEASMQRKEAKAGFGLAADRPVVLMISADLAQAHKGIDFGIQAIRGATAVSGLQALLLGGSAARIAASMGAVPRVCAYAQNEVALARAYRAADVTLIPSLGENFPYAALDSMACGTPVVAFPVGGMPEMIGANERGYLCKRLDPAEMARNLSRLLLDPGAAITMGGIGSQWVRRTCNMGTYLTAIATLYRRITLSAPTAATVTP